MEAGTLTMLYKIICRNQSKNLNNRGHNIKKTSRCTKEQKYYHFGAVFDGLLCVKCTVFTSDPLTYNASVLINKNCRWRWRRSGVMPNLRRRTRKHRRWWWRGRSFAINGRPYELGNSLTTHRLAPIWFDFRRSRLLQSITLGIIFSFLLTRLLSRSLFPFPFTFLSFSFSLFSALHCVLPFSFSGFSYRFGFRNGRSVITILGPGFWAFLKLIGPCILGPTNVLIIQ